MSQPAARTETEFGLHWPGKADAAKAAEQPVSGNLVPLPDESIDFERAMHEFIEGENLQVLKHLLPRLERQVKLIYIDPPYNTGKDFVFRDKFGGNGPSAASRHAAWLSMMYPRLLLAHRTLREDGILLVSIDDVECAHLTLLLNEIFGEENRIGMFIWSGGRKNDSRLMSVSHEYVLCYAKDRSALDRDKITWHERKPGLDRIYAKYARLKETHGCDHGQITQELKRWYKSLPPGDPAKAHAHYCKSDDRGIYFADNLSWPGGGGPTYEVLHPATGRPCRIPSRGWVFATAEKMQAMIADDRIEFGADETKVPTRKRYLHETESQAPLSVFYQDGRAATQRLKRMFGSKIFDHPKDERVLARFVRMMTDGDDLAIDFFAGSGALGHAVLLANAEDGGRRKFLLIQQHEKTGREDYQTIAEIARERLRQAIGEIAPAESGKEGVNAWGLRCFRWDEESATGDEK